MGSTLTVDNIVGATTAASVKLPAGSVLQAQSFDYSGSAFTSSSTSHVATPITVTITPKYSSSKVLILCSTNLRKTTTTTAYGIDLALYRAIGGASASNIRDRWQWTLNWNESQQQWAHWMGHYLDSPSTTSSTVYTLYAKVDSSYGFNIGDSNSGGQMTALEISV